MEKNLEPIAKGPSRAADGSRRGGADVEESQNQAKVLHSPTLQIFVSLPIARPSQRFLRALCPPLFLRQMGRRLIQYFAYYLKNDFAVTSGKAVIKIKRFWRLFTVSETGRCEFQLRCFGRTFYLPWELDRAGRNRLN